MVVGDISHVLTGCSCLDSTTERWDSDHDARWFGTQRTQLGDKPYGCREGSFKESIGTYRDRQGEEMPSNLLILPCLIVSQVDGVLWDLERPLEGPCKLELLDFEHPEGAWFAFVVCPFPLDMRYTQVNVFSGIRLLTSLERLPSVIMVVICVLDPPLMRDSSTRWPSRIGKLDDTGFPLKKILTTIIDLSLRQISLLWKKFLKAPSRKNKSSSVLWCQKRLSLRCLLWV